MRECFITGMLTTIILFCGCHTLGANDTVHFELTRQNVKTAWLKQVQKGHYAALIKLDEPDRKAFSKLTANSIGKRLTISYSGQILTGAVIKSKIDSGELLVGNWASEEEAEEFIANVLRKGEVDISTKGDNEERNGPHMDPVLRNDLNTALAYLSRFDSTKDTKLLIEGLKSIERVIERNHNLISGYYWKAIMLGKLTEFEKAIVALNEGIEQGRDKGDEVVTLLFLRGVVMQKTGRDRLAFSDYNKAVEIYKNRLKTDPRNLDAIMNISQALIFMEKRSEAIIFLNEIIEKDPEEESSKQILVFLEKVKTASIETFTLF